MLEAVGDDVNGVLLPFDLIHFGRMSSSFAAAFGVLLSIILLAFRRRRNNANNIVAWALLRLGVTRSLSFCHNFLI